MYFNIKAVILYREKLLNLSILPVLHGLFIIYVCNRINHRIGYKCSHFSSSAESDRLSGFECMRLSIMKDYYQEVSVVP